MLTSLPTFLSSMFTGHKPDTTAVKQAGKEHGIAYATDYLAGAGEGIQTVLTAHRNRFLGITEEVIDVPHTKVITPARKRKR